MGKCEIGSFFCEKCGRIPHNEVVFVLVHGKTTTHKDFDITLDGEIVPNDEGEEDYTDLQEDYFQHNFPESNPCNCRVNYDSRF